jgi:hypothetical protein
MLDVDVINNSLWTHIKHLDHVKVHARTEEPTKHNV